MSVDLSPLSWVAVAVMLLGTVAALTKRFMATGALLAANSVIFLIVLFAPEATFLAGTDRPAPLHFTQVQADLSLYPPHLIALEPLGLLQFFTSMFVHSDVWHILGNMIFLWAFGMPFEDRIGARRFMAIYLFSGFMGALIQIAVDYNFGAQLPMLGASGAIFGIMASFAAKYPNQVIGVPVPLFFILIRIPMRVVYGALLWIGYNIVLAYASLDRLGGVAYFAHLGGGLAGVLLALVILRRIPHMHGRRTSISIDLSALTPFAHDPSTREVLAHMRANHDEPELFQAWLDRFFRTATCPTCQHRVMPKHRGEVVCTQGHSFDVRRDRSVQMPA